MPIYTVNGVPGIGSTYTATPNIVLQNSAGVEYLEGGRIIDGTASGDWTNPTQPAILTSGIPMGLTSGNKYAPSIIGILTADAASSATTLIVSAAQAVELARRTTAASATTFYIYGPASTGASIATETVTFSAINTSNGHITVTATTNAYKAGSVITAIDGSGLALCLAEGPSGYPIWCLDGLGNRVDTQMPKMIVAGHLVTANIPGYSSLSADTKKWLKAQLNSNGRHFIADDEY